MVNMYCTFTYQAYLYLPVYYVGAHIETSIDQETVQLFREISNSTTSNSGISTGSTNFTTPSKGKPNISSVF